MNTALKSVFILVPLLLMQYVNATSILVEAESFKDRGGWMIDNEFSCQMGSLYLRANGEETSVKNAKTSVIFPDKDKCHVWVRTMNSSNSHKLPTGFRVVVNGKQLKQVPETEAGWKWQYFGQVKIRKSTVSLELKNLKGAEACCDAIYLSSSKTAPPDNKLQLETWRGQQKADKELSVQRFDLVVVGDNTAGYAAAISAAEKGLEVALVSDVFLPSGKFNGELCSNSSGEYGFFERIVKMIESKGSRNTANTSLDNFEKRMKNLNSHENIHLFVNWQAIGVVADNNMIKFLSVKQVKTGEPVRFAAPVFVDCTGSTWISCCAGVDCMYEKDASMQIEEQLHATNDTEAIRFLYPALCSKGILNFFVILPNSCCSYLDIDRQQAVKSILQMGCVVGYAASICVNKGVLPIDVYHSYWPHLMDFIKSSDDEKVFIKQ